MPAKSERIKAPESPRMPPAAAAVGSGGGGRAFRRGPQVFVGALPQEITPGEPRAENAQPWLPVIPAACKRALLELHRAAAQVWT
ncbi:MAG: hypothetical protein ACREQT_04715, partial [Candidatus Binataceae bacterium]